VNLPVGAAALTLIAIGLKHRGRAVAHRIDYTGAAFLTCATVCLLLFLSWGGSVFPWLSPEVLGLAAGASLFYGLLIRQERQAVEPILPLDLFKNRVVVVAISVIGLNAMALFGSLVFLPLYFQLILGASPSRAGLMLAPMMGGVIFASVTGGRLVSRFGRYKPFPVLGLFVSTCSFSTLAWCALEHEPTWIVETALVFLGSGLGFVMPNLTVAIQNSVERSEMGSATSVSSFVRSLGGALGVAVAGSVVSIRLRQFLPESMLPTNGSNLLDLGVQQLAKIPADQHAILMNAYRHAIATTFLTGATTAALAFTIVLFLPERPLRTTIKQDEPSKEETPEAATY
jgi:predicted MFS family arabinose efflux permease